MQGEDEIERTTKKVVYSGCGGCVLIVVLICASAVLITWLLTQ